MTISDSNPPPQCPKCNTYFNQLDQGHIALTKRWANDHYETTENMIDIDESTYECPKCRFETEVE